MKRHKPRILSEKEQRRLFPQDKVFMMDEICTVCGAIKRPGFARGDDGVWMKDGLRTPWCVG